MTQRSCKEGRRRSGGPRTTHSVSKDPEPVKGDCKARPNLSDSKSLVFYFFLFNDETGCASVADTRGIPLAVLLLCPLSPLHRFNEFFTIFGDFLLFCGHMISS